MKQISLVVLAAVFGAAHSLEAYYRIEQPQGNRCGTSDEDEDARKIINNLLKQTFGDSIMNEMFGYTVVDGDFQFPDGDCTKTTGCGDLNTCWFYGCLDDDTTDRALRVNKKQLGATKAFRGTGKLATKGNRRLSEMVSAEQISQLGTQRLRNNLSAETRWCNPDLLTFVFEYN